MWARSMGAATTRPGSHTTGCSQSGTAGASRDQLANRRPRSGPRPAARSGDLPSPPVAPGLPRRQHTSAFCASRRTTAHRRSARRSTAPRGRPVQQPTERRHGQPSHSGPACHKRSRRRRPLRAGRGWLGRATAGCLRAVAWPAAWRRSQSPRSRLFSVGFTKLQCAAAERGQSSTLFEEMPRPAAGVGVLFPEGTRVIPYSTVPGLRPAPLGPCPQSTVSPVVRSSTTKRLPRPDRPAARRPSRARRRCGGAGHRRRASLAFSSAPFRASHSLPGPASFRPAGCHDRARSEHPRLAFQRSRRAASPQRCH
jgi:hypothetical protein